MMTKLSSSAVPDGVDIYSKVNLRSDDQVFRSPVPSASRPTLSPPPCTRDFRLSPFSPGHLPASPIPRGRHKPTAHIPSPAKCLAKDLQVTRLLGSGGFGSVYLATMGEQTVAVKRMHGNSKNAKARLESFRAELKTLHLCHPNLIRMYACTSMDRPGDALIIMEYAGERNLQQLIDDPSQTMDTERRLRYGRQLARGLEYLHQNCVVHLDLKPANVMVTPQNCCKLCDFGCSRVVEVDTGRVSSTLRSYLTGTYAYRAPELLKGEPPSTKADVYSLAVTLWQMLTRESPYRGKTPHVVIFAVVAYNLRPRMSTTCEPEGHPLEQLHRDLICECWVDNPSERPAAGSVADTLDIWLSELWRFCGRCSLGTFGSVNCALPEADRFPGHLPGLLNCDYRIICGRLIGRDLAGWAKRC